MSNIFREYPILIPYQIDFNTTGVGKHIRQTKRHCTWRFGFIHIPSLLDNKTGVACRGIELEVQLVWSVTSRKHILYLNKIPIHQTVPSSSSLAVVPSQRFEDSVFVPEEVLPGGHVIHVTAWALGFGHHSHDKQFTLRFDGQSYNSFSRIYEIGSLEMKRKYATALAKAKEKLDNGGGYVPQNTFSTSSLDGRNRRDMHGQYEQERNGMNQKYWTKPTIPLPPGHDSNRVFPSQYSNEPRPMRRYSNSSAPDSLPHHFLNDAAKNDQEEAELLARARLNSFRDLKRQNDRGGYNNDDATVPTFARPPPSPKKTTYAPQPLQAVYEGKDLLDIDDPPPNDLHTPTTFARRRSNSDITLDTAIKTDDDLMSLASGLTNAYSHIDPTQNWKTQQNLSFRLQQHPPVYADSVAGDLFHPGGSAVSVSGYPSPPGERPGSFAGRHMGMQYPSQNMNMNMSVSTMPQQNQSPMGGASTRSFAFAPPPTWESVNENFGSQSVYQQR